MEQTNALAVAQQMSLSDQLAYANTVCKGSLVPAAYRNQPANVLIAMGLGQSMGLSPAESLYRISVINGNPAAKAELIAANVRRAGHKLHITKNEKAMFATAEITRCDDPDFTFTATWDMAKAQQAKLSDKDNWKKYPMAMLTARAITECARDACSEALYGVVYTAEEMGASSTGPDGEPKPVQVEAQVEQVDLAPVRSRFKAYKQATGADNDAAMRAVCEAVGVSGMHEMGNEQVEKAARFMDEAIAQADEAGQQAQDDAAADAGLYEQDVAF